MPDAFDTTPVDLDRLILNIEGGIVVPVLGPELYVDEAGVSIERKITAGLAAELGLEAPGAADTPRRLALAYLRRGNGRLQALKSAMRHVVEHVVQVPPPPLRHLAEIDGLRLYVTTTPDAMLEHALTEAGRPPIVRSYSPQRPAIDVPPMGSASSPVVCHLLGSVAADAFPTTDADVLEYLYALASESRRPAELFDELRDRSLMFLGCGFPDWLLRFFIRTVKGTPFTRDEDQMRVVADGTATHDRELALFLQLYNHDLWLAPPGPAAAFVATLHARWQARPMPTAAEPGPEIPDGGVFLSFSSADRATVEPIFAALKEAGIDVFFDAHAIEPGDAWDQLIQRKLIRAALVLAFVSKHTEAQARDGRPHYFWKEWHLANDRAEYQAPGAKYLLPIVLDDGIDPAQAQVFDRFRQVQWFPLPERRPTPALVAFVLNEYRRKVGGRRS